MPLGDESVRDPHSALVIQVAASFAAAVAAGVLPITAVLEAFEPRRLESFRSFPMLTHLHLNLLTFTTVQHLERLLTVKTVQLMIQAQEARHPKHTKVQSVALSLKHGRRSRLCVDCEKHTASSPSRQAIVELQN